MFNLEPEDAEFLIACCIGDGGLRVQKGCVSLTLKHGDRQREYIHYKAAELNRILRRNCAVRAINNSGYPGWSFTVTNTEQLKPIHAELYGDGEKRVTEKLLVNLGVRAFAVWWMDDGSLTIRKQLTSAGNITNGARIGWLSTYTRTIGESELIAEWVSGIIGAKPLSLLQKGRWRLHFNSHALRLLCPILEPHIIPSLKYKVDFGAIYQKRRQTSPSMFLPKNKQMR